MSMPLGAAGSFCPGSPNQKISNYPSFLDAADGLLNDAELYPQANGPGILLTADGRRLIEKMGLTPKPMKRLKITGSDASDLVDKMFSELE